MSRRDRYVGRYGDGTDVQEEGAGADAGAMDVKAYPAHSTVVAVNV